MSTSLSPKLTDARALWRLCFQDDERFVDFYFSQVATDEETLLYYIEEREPIAHIGLPVYHLRLGQGPSDEVACVYISGACVHPDHRRGGLMRQLMTQVLQETAGKSPYPQEPDRAAVILIPASEELRQYYTRHFGFVTIGYRHYSPEVPAHALLSPEPCRSPGAMASDYRRSAHALLAHSRTLGDYGLYHSQHQWEALEREYALYPSSAIEYVQDEEGLYLGLALARLSEGTIYIDYIVAQAGSGALEQLVGALRQRWGADRPILYRHANRPGGEPWGMIRPVRLLPFLRRYALREPQAVVSFAYTDDLIPELTGTYHLAGGSVTFSAGVLTAPRLSLEAICQRFVPPIDISLVHE